MFELCLPVDRSSFPRLGSALREASGVDNNERAEVEAQRQQKERKKPILECRRCQEISMNKGLATPSCESSSASSNSLYIFKGRLLQPAEQAA